MPIPTPPLIYPRVLRLKGLLHKGSSSQRRARTGIAMRNGPMCFSHTPKQGTCHLLCLGTSRASTSSITISFLRSKDEELLYVIVVECMHAICTSLILYLPNRRACKIRPASFHNCHIESSRD